ncbi:hypothetical protein K9O30_12605 [Clostridium bowmanii]|uniref:hypothetical protein n=1 Tax=Clostridium bowmanii TaxID=132925 RepID=UPI001C0C0747|nr:hypothetical protein [Clostridium bowmanii]MBU3190015.1 hypothetical protein [Clostridium bowmanii]MCA1074548.1 hypothetical protein [Clostridium bowmanii]
MKKAVSILMASLIIISLTACGAKKETAKDVATTKKVSDKLIVYSPHRIEFIDPVVNEFHGI